MGASISATGPPSPSTPSTCFCSIRSRCDQGPASRPASARMDAPAATGPIIAVACSHAIEMQPAFALVLLMPLMPLATPWLRQQTVTATHTRLLISSHHSIPTKKSARHAAERLAQQPAPVCVHGRCAGPAGWVWSAALLVFLFSSSSSLLSTMHRQGSIPGPRRPCRQPIAIYTLHTALMYLDMYTTPQARKSAIAAVHGHRSGISSQPRGDAHTTHLNRWQRD